MVDPQGPHRPAAAAGRRPDRARSHTRSGRPAGGSARAGRDTGTVTSLDSPRYAYEAPVSADLFDRGQQITPGGVNSPVRAFRAVGGTPRFMVSAAGPDLTDPDGRRYVDLVRSWGPMLLGPAHPAAAGAPPPAP